MSYEKRGKESVVCSVILNISKSKQLLCSEVIQQMLKIIISIIAIVGVSTLTNLTTSNCPQNFDPNIYNDSLTYSNSNLALSLYGSVLSSSLQANITASLAQGNLYPLVNNFTSASFLMPYIVIAGGFGFLFLVTLCCYLFERRCPPCKSCRRNYVKEPYRRWERRLALVFGVFFSAGVVVASIVAFSSFTLLRSDINMIKCGMYYSVDVATNGDQSASWGGFGQIQSQMSSVVGYINATAAAVNTGLHGNGWITQGFAQLQNMNLNLWTNNENSVVYSPDPSATAAAMAAGNPLPTIVPLFIGEGLGPNGTADTMITDLSNGLGVTNQLVEQAEATYQSAITFAASASNITVNLNANVQKISMATAQLSSIKVAMDFFVNNYLQLVVTDGIFGMEALFGLILLAGLILLLGVVSTHIFDLFGCKKMVNGGWVLLGILYFGVLAILLVFLLVGGVSYCFCQYFEQVITSDVAFVNYSMASQFNSVNHFFQYLDVCFFSDGNIFQKFWVTEQMLTISDLFLNIQTYLNMQTVGNAEYVDLTISTGKILGWMTAMSNYGLGLYVDASSSVITQANPYVALANLNLITLAYNSTGTQNICANDLWVFDATNCSHSASESLYVPSNDNTNGLYFPLTGSLCISLNSRLSNAAPSIWTATDISERYLNNRECNSGSVIAYNSIVQYAQSLTNYRDSRINLYQSLYNQLNGLLTVNTNYNTNMSTFTSNVNTFFSSVSGLNNLVTNQINGVTISSNCSVVGSAVRFFYNMYCVNFFNRSVKIAVCCMILLVLMLGAVLAGACFALRFDRIERQRQMKVQVDSEVLKEQISARTEESADSVSSEDNN